MGEMEEKNLIKKIVALAESNTLLTSVTLPLESLTIKLLDSEGSSCEFFQLFRW